LRGYRLPLGHLQEARQMNIAALGALQIRAASDADRLSL